MVCYCWLLRVVLIFGDDVCNGVRENRARCIEPLRITDHRSLLQSAHRQLIDDIADAFNVASDCQELVAVGKVVHLAA